MNASSMKQAGSAGSEFVGTRTVDAPRDKVFKAWTDVEELKKWWGPKGVEITFAKLDLKPGGIFHYGMKTADGKVMWGKLTYREISKPSKLVFVVEFSDEKGGQTRHPLAPNWPLQMLSTVTFDEMGDKTKITVRWSALNATALEQKTFDESHDSMRQGWAGTFERLEDYLKSS